jgi:colanic acid/amylovoran biosynthesis glycosyltransferase
MTKQVGIKEHYSRLRTFIPLALEKPDVVHFEWNSVAIACLPLFEVWECPIVISCRGRQINVQPHVPGSESFLADLALTFRKAAAVHCVSEAIRNEAIQYGLDPGKAIVIPPAVDPEFFKPAPAKDQSKAFTIITVGSLIWRKGYEYALIAVRRVLDAGIETVYEIIGDGLDRQRVLYTIHDLGLEGVVRLHGYLNPDAVRARLQQADVFLLSSLSEGISNAALEGMACGLPIVTTDCGGMREAITDGVEGFIVPVRDPEAMAQALKILATDEGLRYYMGKAARERVLQQFSLESQINAFIKLYQVVAS